MKTILIMPVKKNSSRLKNKNILPILDKPMFIFTLFEAMKCKFIDKFYVSTESEEIIKICKNYKVNFIKRPKRLSKKKKKYKKFIKVKAKTNRLFAFKRSPISYHSVEKSNSNRVIILINFNYKNKFFK